MRVEKTVRKMPASVNSFVGREKELNAAKSALRDGTTRLLTLTGPGGIGKTRLAEQIAVEADTTSFAPGGACLVNLAEVPRRAKAPEAPDDLAQAVCEALEIKDQSNDPHLKVICNYLTSADKQILLILDNCEPWVREVAAVVRTLLAEVPALLILATSRERLGLDGEQALAVPPLPVPGEDEPVSRAYEAIALFEDRAAAAVPGWRVDEANRVMVAALAAALDGLPLAIELAAARMAHLTPTELLERLSEGRFELLARSGLGGRGPSYHDTLRKTIEVSYEGCTETERLLWQRLSVFAASGFTLTTAEAICVDEALPRAAVLDLLSGLIRKSVVDADTTSGDRTQYRMLESIREFGREQLAASGEGEKLRKKHRDYYSAVVRKADSEWFTDHEVDWMRELSAELPNIRTVIRRCGERGEPEAQRIPSELAYIRLFFFRGRLRELQEWLTRGVRRATPAREAAIALSQAAWCAYCQGDPDAAVPLLERARHFAEQVDEELPEMDYAEGAHQMLALSDPESIRTLGRAVEGFRARGHYGRAHQVDLVRVLALMFLSTDSAAVLDAARALLAEATGAGAPWSVSWAQWALAAALLTHGDQDGDRDRALELLRESLAAQRDWGERWGTVWGVTLASWIYAAAGRFTEAAEELGRASRMHQLTGVAVSSIGGFDRAHEQAYAATRDALGAQEFAVHYANGLTTGDYHAVLARSLGEPAPGPGRHGAVRLTRREREIAVLLTKAMTSRDIAQHLRLSHRTIESHLDSIRSKADLKRREDIPPWVRKYLGEDL